ncbi:MAG: methyltransferase domain-containing protein [Alphaproteobacteria bacterium]|nr:methyltransferase domain-containing protein [Alphaproteobacteria bacterium]
MQERAGDRTTEDALLDGRVRLRQPKQGYRVATDPVYLAAAVPARPGERVLDLGLGVGAAALCLAWRARGAEVVGVEVQGDLAHLAEENGRLNGLAVRVVVGDVMALPFKAGSFDHVMANPPFLVRGNATSSPLAGKARADLADHEADLDAWIAAGLHALRSGGTLTLIQRADRLDAVLAGLAGRGGGIVVFPLWPRAAIADAKRVPANRVIVQAIKGSRAPLRLAQGLVVHGPGNGYSAAALAVLRAGEALALARTNNAESVK